MFAYCTVSPVRIRPIADGTRRWMLFAGRDLGDGTIGEFCVDITDLKTAEMPHTA